MRIAAVVFAVAAIALAIAGGVTLNSQNPFYEVMGLEHLNESTRAKATRLFVASGAAAFVAILTAILSLRRRDAAPEQSPEPRPE